MNIRILRQWVLPAVLCAQLAAVALPAAGQSGTGPDELQRAADELADKLVDAIRGHPELHRQRMALQPLDPGEFVALDKRERRRLHDLLVGSLESEIKGSYDLVDPSNFTAIARILEGRLDPDWFDRYMELFRKAEAQINIECTASPSSVGKFAVSCKAFTMDPVESRGTAQGEFSKDWLTAPVDPDWALASIAREIVGHMQGVGGLDKVSSVDSKTGAETRLSGEVAKMLLDAFSKQQESWSGLRPVGGSKARPGYRAKVEVQHFQDKLDLRVELYSGPENTFERSFRESVHWTPELRQLDGAAEGRPVSVGECGAGADPGERQLPDKGGQKLKHWALLTEHRLKTGDKGYFLDVLVQAKTYLAEHCEWDRVSKILDIAISGLAKELGANIEEKPGEGLEELLNVEASAGKHLVLLELRARAYELLGNRREQDRAYTEWLEIAPDDSAVVLPILEKQERIRVEIEREDNEIALGLDGAKRSLVRRGLASFGHDGGEGSAEFDASFRVALRSWQAKNERVETGYLTADQAQALMAEGRAVEEREKDDAAFARAKAVNTAAAYEKYLARYPDGHHAAQAKRLLDIAKAREDEERAREAAQAAERALALEAGEQVLIERGLASWQGGGSEVDGRFDASFRALLRSWQASKGHLDTGYLTRGQAKELMGLGTAFEEREKDDAAFARAKKTNTAASYEAYLSKFPNGHHAVEARRRLEVVRVHADDAAFARAKRTDTEESYAAYLSQYPEGRHAAEAKRLREEARVLDVAAAAEEALLLTWAERKLIQRGLASKVRGGAVNGQFHAAFRTALRSWQASNGHAATGYLTRGQAKELMGLGTAFEEREKDDAAFARAKKTSTVASYEAYLSKFPNGRHAVEARRLREAAREREERKKVAAPADVERALGLADRQKELVQYGLVSKGYKIGAVDGVLGRRTRAAIRSYQGQEGLARTGFLTARISDALQALGRRHVERVRAAWKPGHRFRDCDGTWCPEMVVVPAGSFMMGSPESEAGRRDSEGPVHRVTIAEPFAVGVHEVTRGEWSRFALETGHTSGDSCWTYEGGEWKEHSGRSWLNPGFRQGEEHPVVCVNWKDAKAYVRWLSRETGEAYRLLSESEWEYVARAHTITSRHWDDSEIGQCRYSNGADRSAKSQFSGWTVASCDDGYVHTAPVGSFGSNGFGLHDVLGNVWEWVEDCWHDSYRGAPRDGRAWTTGGDCGKRMLRGGSWFNIPRNVRSAYRVRGDTGIRIDDVGFRVARTLD